MTSEERHEKRYQRRVRERSAKKKLNRSDCDNFDSVFSYKNLYKAYRLCRRNVAWKVSVQKFITQAPLMVNQLYGRLKDGSYRSSGFYEFDLHERGKLRHIKSTTIGERVVQRCLCDNALVPMIVPTLIYDNGASTKNRGYHFAIRRLCIHLREHYRKYGAEGYILLFDYRKFFDSIPHSLCKGIMQKEFHDERIRKLTNHFIDAFGDVGLGLGSQISQTFAIACASRMDHFIKEVLGIRGYGRYSDDGYLIHHSKEYLRFCLECIKELSSALGLSINEKKTRIVKISHGFSYLKARFFLTDKGKVIKKIYKRSVTVERRKLKKFVAMVESGVMTYEDVYHSFQSWKAYAMNFNAWHTIQNMCKLFNELFVHPWANGQTA